MLSNYLRPLKYLFLAYPRSLAICSYDVWLSLLVKLEIGVHLECSLELGYPWGVCWDQTARLKHVIRFLGKGWEVHDISGAAKASDYNMQS